MLGCELDSFSSHVVHLNTKKRSRTMKEGNFIDQLID
jgi:hypothetical protein